MKETIYLRVTRYKVEGMTKKMPGLYKGDYIIRGVNGEFYPCKPDIFKNSYIEVL